MLLIADPNNMDVVVWLETNWPGILAGLYVIATSFITAASVIVKVTKTKADDSWLAKIIAILKIISMNKGDVK